MSRLDSFIRRMTAQRDILNSISSQSLLPESGDILEIGLGNGRTYHHLRELYPERRIIAFDRAVLAHSSSIPDPTDMVVGEIEETTRSFVGRGAALMHADIGAGNDQKDAVTLTWLPTLASELLAPGGIAISGLPLEHVLLLPLPLPLGIDSQRYFLYRNVN